MTFFNLISIICSYCVSKEYHFLAGENFYQNYEASQNEYKENDIIVSARFNASPGFNKGLGISQVSYSGELAVGDGKLEATTVSNLDETFIQKYDNRLVDLSNLLTDIISDLACANELEIISVTFRLELNRFDENIDFVIADITFIQ